MAVSYRKYKKMTKAERAAAYAKRANPNRIKKEENFKRTCELIEQAVDYRGLKNIILTGGVALNCVNNFKYVQKFKDINFFIDPVPHDAGTAIGVALYCNDYK